jgi:branched-chain amino acid transport system ATP-binding protein
MPAESFAEPGYGDSTPVRSEHHAIALDALSGADPAPGSRKPDPILVADSVIRRFGGLVAVDVRHLEIQRGSITALIGPNGAGKTTLFNLLTGFDQPEAGAWTFDGQVISGLPSYRVARRGMVRTFQLTKALAKLTVLDNMRLGATRQRGGPRWPRRCGAARRRRSPSARRACCSGSTWSGSPTISPGRCPAANASCWRWPER